MAKTTGLVNPVVAVVGYTGGVGTCLIVAMERINLKPFALVRSKTMRLVDEGDVPVDYTLLENRLLEA
eukprot:CAMPEP_0113297900 /NCGR_PEP_ID=MMETSP0010_2-20120614/569_1 /TAXON_ID=216773 ORGANISM="Corethron hystrix, Strain 308" /NCGR_SAMPLE_ID=MMETSP0010_2 /ASSEMBLY_ACC=CAM_ASM_000155 /LENGTH=67 /DNA_ID=CAMNT_0000150865 /DNA_START=50 /DNA_END=250 /DNA_ORIENTATION=+ /assembly_acc=CAM_ASM_000155